MPQGGSGCPMCESLMGMGWGIMVLFALFWLAVIVLVGWLIYRVVSRRRTTGSRGSSEEILEDRYARGEIDRDTFLRIREDLEAGDEK